MDTQLSRKKKTFFPLGTQPCAHLVNNNNNNNNKYYLIILEFSLF
jgi:hypothetical protein